MEYLSDLARMEKGNSGTVAAIEGGRGLAERLLSLGIRPGSTVTKISGLWGHGPVVINVSGTEVALGFGMAKKVKVNINQN